jgi:hypothetical protein
MDLLLSKNGNKIQLEETPRKSIGFTICSVKHEK